MKMHTSTNCRGENGGSIVLPHFLHAWPAFPLNKIGPSTAFHYYHPSELSHQLSLYSTATQTKLRWAHHFALGIPICLYLKKRKKLNLRFSRRKKKKNCVSPYAKPQRQPVEYRLCWVPGVGSLRWACTFNIFCVDFICIGHPTQTRFSVEYGLYVFKI